MRVALDAMGGDNAPSVNVEGAIELVQKRPDIKVILVGPEEVIKAELKAKGYAGERISVFHASEIVEMHESAMVAMRKKKDSSIRRAVDLVKKGEADAVVSAGNSGAVMATALFVLGRSAGVDRPAFATVIPSERDPFLLLDAGANVDCSPENLYQFALMGNAYSRLIMDRENPRVGLLSIGEEETKGNEVTKATHKLLKETTLCNFTGNVESKEVYLGEADVVVCDGFIGNIFLKTSEGLVEFLMRLLKKEIGSTISGKLGYLFMRPGIKRVKKKTDYDEYGGAPLLGINGACIICHGRSSPKAIMNAMRIASDFASKKVYEVIAEDIAKINSQIETEQTVA